VVSRLSGVVGQDTIGQIVREGAFVSTKVDDCMTGAPLGFWDYAVATQKGRDDDLGAFLRLIGRRVIAPPQGGRLRG
jgi:hypothetical protein